MSAARTLRAHWPEYLIEGWALGMFMISAGLVTTLFDSPDSPVNRALHDSDLQRVLIGMCMGLTAMALIYSPWGKRSGAHMNPAVTLTFLRLGHVARWDALFYIVAQFAGGTLGVLLVWIVLGEAFANPPIRYVATLPGAYGVSVALIAELAISFAMMTVILRMSNSPRLMQYTGVCAGVLVALWISIEGPLSGMSMNPARTFASALPGNIWTAFWIYVLAPVAGMQAAAALFVWQRGRGAIRCSKLVHTADQRCIHCGYRPHTSGELP
ncbi:MAG TPA: aquaporin [Steroidobacteraceae bacterium]|nr:aquaporin [Steroidobacteraceae bacterium]